MPLMKPAFLADYRNARRVRPPIAFTRNSLQSYAGPLGVLAQVAANEPAITFDAATLACLGTPNEQQSTNVLLRSNAFSTSPWDTLVLGTGTAPTLTPNAGVAPDGTATAWRLQCNIGAGTTTGDQSRIFQDVSGLASPHDLTPSIWIKSNTGVNQSVYFRNVTGVGGSTVTATPEWRRVWIPNAAVATTTESIQIGCRGTHSQGSIDVLIWEAQMELGLMPTSNVHTDGSTVTRAATSQIISGSEFTSRYNPNAMTVVAKFVVPYAWPTINGRGLMWFNSGTNARGIALVAAVENGVLSAVQRDDSGAQITASLPIPAAGTVCTALMSFTPAATNFALNGASAAASGSRGVMTIDRLHVHESRASGSNLGPLNCALLKAAWYPYAASQAECAAMSLSE